MAARIFVVCDLYDAQISDRAYKLAWGQEATGMEIKRLSDTGMVSAFVDLIVSDTWEPDKSHVNPQTRLK